MDKEKKELFEKLADINWGNNSNPPKHKLK